MKILITGSAGFLGCNLSRALLREGHELWGIDNLSVGRKKFLPLGMKFLEADICKDIINFQNVHTIIHLASRKIPREGNASKVLRDNALGIIRIVELAKIYKANLIYLSSSEVYGLNHASKELSNFVFGHPKNVRWSYGLSKAFCENYLFCTDDVKFKIIRLFATYGPWNCMHWRAGPIPVFIEQALNKEPFTIHGTGQQKRCFQYVDDAIDGILKVIKLGENRCVYNIGNPNESISIYDLAKKIYHEINKRSRAFIPVKHINPVMNLKSNYEEIQLREPDIDSAVKNLDFNPKITLEEGLKLTINWHKSQREEKMETERYAGRKGIQNMQ